MNLRTLGLLLAMLTLAVGCSERPLRPLNPCTISGVTNKLGSNVNEVDMLFMVDTSNSMLEEQALLRAALPELVAALVAGQSPSDDTQCMADPANCRIFRPVKSLRVGVITSDIGTIQEGSGCVGDGENAEILSTPFRNPADPACGTTITPIARPDFLQFDEGDGATAQQDFEDRFACYVDVGGGGCGYEQQLEAVLKSLAGSRDGAEPVEFIDFGGGTSAGNGAAGGPNAGFLRPNSLLAIVMVTDEDDCSGTDSSLYVSGGAFQSDSTADVWADWSALRWTGGDPAMGEINTVAEAAAIDAADPDAPRDLQLRCFEYTQFLYGVDRYYRGILDFRDPQATDLIVFAAITGVDQQVVEAARAAEAADGTNRFAYMLADPSMQESVDYAFRDLRQYTTAPTDQRALDRPRPACVKFEDTWTTSTFPQPSTFGGPCDTTAECVANMAPLSDRVPPIECNLAKPNGGQAGTCEQAGAAAPARRIIEVAQGIEAGGGNALIESICQDDFSGALNEIINKLADVLNRACLPEPLNPDSAGLVNCEVVEYLPTAGDYTTCQQVADAGLGRDPEPVRTEDGRQVCRIQQIAVTPAERLAGMIADDTIPGWYYDDFTTGTMGESAQELCMTEEGTFQRIAFTELGKPVAGASVRLECLQPAVGGTVDDAQVATPCGFTTADLDPATRICQGEVAASQPEGMICDSLSNTCQFACNTSADCPGGFVCYSRDEFAPDPAGRTACTGPGDCVDPAFPVCGTSGFCISEAEEASTRAFCANPTCDTTGIGGT